MLLRTLADTFFSRKLSRGRRLARFDTFFLSLQKLPTFGFAAVFFSSDLVFVSQKGIPCKFQDHSFFLNLRPALAHPYRILLAARSQLAEVLTPGLGLAVPPSAPNPPFRFPPLIPNPTATTPTFSMVCWPRTIF